MTQRFETSALQNDVTTSSDRDLMWIFLKGDGIKKIKWYGSSGIALGYKTKTIDLLTKEAGQIDNQLRY